MILVLSLLAVLIILPYVVGPMIVKRQFRHRLEPELTPVQAAEMPGDAADYLELTESVLRDAGFLCVGRARIDTVRDVAGWVSLMVHRENRDIAQAGVVARLEGDEIGPVEERHVEFVTRWPGRELLTNNSRQIMSFDPVRGQSVIRFVDMDDIALLYRIHRARVRADGSASSALLPEPGAELKALATMNRDWMKAQEARGNVAVLEAESDMYGLTWRGAMRATWRQLWPFTGIGMRRTRRRARSLIRTLDLDFEVPAEQVGQKATAPSAPSPVSAQ